MYKKMIQNKWWKTNVETRKEEFNSWLGDYSQEDRVKARQLIKDAQHKTVLDCACGYAIEYEGFVNDKIEILYTGIDSTEVIVNDCASRGLNVVQGNLESIPFNDGTFDVVYARHILEHLSDYKIGLKELIRCAKHEVIINFFLPPTSDKADMKVDANLNNEVYVNRYCIEDIEKTLKANKKVASWRWEPIRDYSLLSILLK